MKLNTAKTIAVASTLLLVLSGCSTSSTTSAPKMLDKLGANEKTLTLLGWPGYAEDGSNDPSVDWVTPFEKSTGCQVTFKSYGTSDEALSLFKTGDYDGIAASGDATLRLIAGNYVQPLNTSLIPSYKDVYSFLKDRAWNTVDGKTYGVPHGYGANLLMYNTEIVKPAPTSWKVVFDGSDKWRGTVTAYDSPIYIADAALYLMKTNPAWKITNPYALDKTQLAGAVKLLKYQRKNIGEYWSDYLKSIQSFTSGASLVGTTWQVIKNSMPAGSPVKAIMPKEGATGWSDSWMVAANAKHVNCAYQWLNYIDTPKANAAATEYFGEAPVTQGACQYASDPTFCDTYHAGDAAYAAKIWYWTTPISKCLDGRTNVKCTDYAAWTKAWQDVQG